MTLPGHPEIGGFIYAIGNSSRLAVEQAAPGSQRTLTLPTIIPFNTNLTYHVHGQFGPDQPQGPSGQDAITTKNLGIPGAIISHDSLFFITTDGKATGCAR